MSIRTVVEVVIGSVVVVAAWGWSGCGGFRVGAASSIPAAARKPRNPRRFTGQGV
jgi:hypothetical protein